MAYLFSATDRAIADAIQADTLSIEERPSRFSGETFASIADQSGTIEVHSSTTEAEARVSALRELLEL